MRNSLIAMTVIEMLPPSLKSIFFADPSDLECFNSGRGFEGVEGYACFNLWRRIIIDRKFVSRLEESVAEQAIKVFISYSWDSEEHRKKVLSLAQALRDDGIDCMIDQFVLSPDNWDRWMLDQIDESNFVLIVCSERYYRRYRGKEEVNKGLGVTWESTLIMGRIYDAQGENGKFYPVFFTSLDRKIIPDGIRTSFYDLSGYDLAYLDTDSNRLKTDGGYKELYRLLTHQPSVVPKKIGSLRKLDAVNTASSNVLQESGTQAKTIPAAPRPSNSTFQNFSEDLGNGIELEMVAIPGKLFFMGSPDNEAGRSNWEGPQHRVEVPSFWMGKYTVTQEQWWKVAKLPKINHDLNPDPSKFKGEHHPVECVSWWEAVEFCDRLSRKTGNRYRLPTEAEWEYACRAGTKTPFHFGETITPELANYGQYDGTTAVGKFTPNAFGLYDMHGNVWEWCVDHWHENYQGAPIDGSAWLIIDGDSNARVTRGGSWLIDPDFCRSAFRNCGYPGNRHYDLGFRVVCGLA